MVSLQPMSAEAWEAWRIASIRGYAEEKVRAGTWPADGAQRRAVEEFATLLTDGRHTPGHEFRSIVTDAEKPVGVIWFAPQREIGRGAAFIYDIVIEAAQRGHGYGRAAMEALPPLARALGYDTIRLHAFGHNNAARSRSRTVGYAETDVQIEKQI